MRKLRVYIAGPMSQLPNKNREAFFAAAEKLEKAGFEPVNPATLPNKGNYMKRLDRCLEMLKHCDEMVLLPGWQHSKGVMNYELPMAILYHVGVWEINQLIRIKSWIRNQRKRMEDERSQTNQHDR